MVKALIIKTSALGDVVQVFPAVQFLSQVSPGCEIDWVVEARAVALVQAHPLIRKTFLIDTKRWRKEPFTSATMREIKDFMASLRSSHYDVVFDFQGNLKSGLLTKLAKGDLKVGFSKNYVSEYINTFFTQKQVEILPHRNIRFDYISLVEAWSNQSYQGHLLTRLRLTSQESILLNRLKMRKAHFRNIMVCPGSQWPNKQLLSETLIAFLKKIDRSSKCKFWLIYGSEEERALSLQIQQEIKEGEICEKMSLPLLQHWMGEMDHVIAMDSLPLHLAAEAGIATFSVFGASSANKYQPLGVVHSAFQGVCPYGQRFEKRCPILRSCSTGACIHSIDPNSLFESYLRFVEQLPCRN